MDGWMDESITVVTLNTSGVEPIPRSFVITMCLAMCECRISDQSQQLSRLTSEHQ